MDVDLEASVNLNQLIVNVPAATSGQHQTGSTSSASNEDVEKHKLKITTGKTDSFLTWDKDFCVIHGLKGFATNCKVTTNGY